MLKLIGFVAVVAVAAYFTNPSAATMSAAADAKLKGVTEAAAENVDLGGALGGIVAQASDGRYESFYVAGHYVKPVETPLVECWGAFTLTSCAKVGSPE